MRVANKVAINTVIQYTRLLLNFVISLYSVRVILNALGASDYGIYDVIAGVIAILGFLNSSLSQTSIRYLSVSLGKNNLSDLRNTFNNCFWLHLFIAIGIVAVLEFIGLFIFDGFLNIPKERIEAARIVFHCMSVTMFLHIFITPFSAFIISHENFFYSSCISILDALLKLGIAFFLAFTTGDKLVVYGILMMTVVIINVVMYILYIFVKYKDEFYIGKPSFKGIKKQSKFAGWTIIDVLGTIANRQGYAIMLNKFFGPVTNAAFALARQIEGQIYTISAAVIDTIKPQIMKSYGSNDRERMFKLSMTAGKFGFILMSFIAIPLIVMMPLILELWLKSVPESTVTFARLMVLACMSEQLTRGLVYACQAIGHIKWFSIIVSCIRVSALPISVLLLSLGCSAYVAIIVFFICEVTVSITRIFVISKLENISSLFFFQSVISRVLPSFVVAFLLCFTIHFFCKTLLTMIFNIIITSFSYLILIYLVGLSAEEKYAINNIIKSVFHRNER